MKIRGSLIAMVFFTSVVAGLAQETLRTPGRQSPAFVDPFDVLPDQMNAIGTHRPNTNISAEQNLSSSTTTVSLEQLQHKVSSQAWKEYKKGRKACSKGDYENAVNHLQNTIQLDSDFADGHNDLGVALEKLGNFGEAADEFQKAVNLAPNHKQAIGNLVLSLYLLQRYRDVVPLAQRALKGNPSLLYVHYVLGVSLIAANGNRKEALDNLERAAPNFPEARLIISQLLAQKGRRGDAAWELEEYLRAVPKTDPTRQKAEVQLAQLRR